jgi:hypothetical protein
MITVNDLPQIIGLLGYGFAIGAGGGIGAFILVSIVNTFYSIANKG